jgi:hypothetical protein
MKKFLLGFLMLMMLTPSLACAMPMCADETQAAKAEQPCADHVSHHGDKESIPKNKAGLMADCMGVDFQTADTTSLEKSDIKTSPIFFAVVDETTFQFLGYTDTGTIRGPPPDWPAPSRTHPPILLTTQRFRI